MYVHVCVSYVHYHVVAAVKDGRNIIILNSRSLLCGFVIYLVSCVFVVWICVLVAGFCLFVVFVLFCCCCCCCCLCVCGMTSKHVLPSTYRWFYEVDY